MEEVKILWADDEIDLLKPHVLFLEGRGYQVTTVNNGDDAIEMVQKEHYDVIFLDENMPGLSGLETLSAIKENFPAIPVVMITKSEEEHIMEDAIGARISDYLIKPVNPKQIIMAIKKNVHTRQIQSEKTVNKYMQDFRNIGMELNNDLSVDEWFDVYKKLISWDIDLHQSGEINMLEILSNQMDEANLMFSRFIENNYFHWMKGERDAPVMSHNVVGKWLLPIIKKQPNLFFIVIDNLRFDQWKSIRPILSENFRIESEKSFLSILPTATQYARNALFAGMMPSEIARRYPDKWKDENDEGSKNEHEDFFFEEQLQRNGVHFKVKYNKVTNLDFGKKLVDNFTNLLPYDINVIVYNFVDMLSHARTDMKVIKELANDESAYRSLTTSWFEHSPLLELIKLAAEKGMHVVITTDHGTKRVTEPSKVIGEKSTNSNLRYKCGRNLNYNKKDVLEVNDPQNVHLPKSGFNQKYIFAKDNKYFVYQNNYNHFVHHFKDTFQHGGISLEEMVIPFVHLSPKK